MRHRYDAVKNMLDKIGFSADDRLICAGDYIDRGPKSYEMLIWIENPGENVILVRGNHQIFDWEKGGDLPSIVPVDGLREVRREAKEEQHMEEEAQGSSGQSAGGKALWVREGAEIKKQERNRNGKNDRKEERVLYDGNQ